MDSPALMLIGQLLCSIGVILYISSKLWICFMVVGFLLVIWDLIKGAEGAGWALIVIVVVSALQTIAAIYALLLDAGVMSAPAPRPKYDQYQGPYGGGYG